MPTQHNKNVVRSFLGFIRKILEGRLPGRASRKLALTRTGIPHNILKPKMNSNVIQGNKKSFAS